MSEKTDLEALFTKKIEASKLDKKDAKKLKFELCGAKKVKSLELPDGQGFKLPYFDIYGNPTDFFRFRYLHRPPKKGFSKLSNKKEIRYTQPKDTVTELYYPPLVKWSKIAESAAEALIITEGELKAACATKYIMPCIGLGGVWNWKSKSMLYSHLPGFDCFKWSGREVYVIFDSDSVQNYKVQHAQHALCVELMRLGAQPLVCELPSLIDKEGEKVKAGLDDLIAHWGAEQVKDHVYQTSEYFYDIKELKKLNTEVIYIRDPGVILRYKGNLKISPKAFVDHAYSDRMYTVEETTGSGDVKSSIKSAPREWLKWKGRAVVERMTYAPGEGKFLEDAYNVWPGWGVEPKRGNIKPWRELIDFLFSNAKPEHKKWFEQWLAYPLQNPGVKMYTYCLLWSVVHGVGKSLIGDTMNEIYGENGKEIGASELNSTCNMWAEKTQFVLGDEIVTEDVKKRMVSERLKKMITQSKILIDIKYVPKFFERDCINYFLTSNHPNAVYLEDRDRRGFIHEVAGEPKPLAFYKEYRNWYRSKEGAGALFYHLLNLDLKGFDPQGHAPVTFSKLGMISSSRSELDNWVSELKKYPENVLISGGQPVQHDLMTAEEVHFLYDPEGSKRVTINGIGRALKKYGFEQVCDARPIRLPNGAQKRLWVIGNKDKLMRMRSQTKVSEYYANERTKRKKYV